MKRLGSFLVLVVICAATAGCPEIERVVSINRSFSADFEEDLIAMAEAACPDREAVQEVFRGGEIPGEDECLWWDGTFDGVRTAYAITDDAIAYYQTTFAELRDARRANGRPVWLSLTLVYDASVSMVAEITTETATYENVYVVEMELSWGAVCGGLCAHSFSRERLVIFDEEGNLLEVVGDGPVQLAVS